MNWEMDRRYTVRALPAMAPLQDPAFSWVIRTNSINGTRNCNLIGAVDLLEHIPVCHLSSSDAKCMSYTVSQVTMQLENTMSESDNFILSWTEYLFEWSWRNAQCISQNKVGRKDAPTPESKCDIWIRFGPI